MSLVVGGQPCEGTVLDLSTGESPKGVDMVDMRRVPGPKVGYSPPSDLAVVASPPVTRCQPITPLDSPLVLTKRP